MWRRVCTRAPATADIFYSFEVERKKGTRRGNKNTKSRPRQSAKAATGACVGGCTKNSIVRGDAIDRSIDRSCPFPRFSNVPWSSNDRSTSTRSFRSIRSSVRRTRCTCTSIQRASSMGRTMVLLNCVPCRKSRRHVDGSCQRMLLSYVRGFPFNYD